MSTNEPPSYPGDQPDPTDSSGTSGLPKYGSVEPPAGYEPPPAAPPAGGGQVSPQEPYSAAAAIGWGWRKFTQNVGGLLAAVLVMFGVSIALNFVLSLSFGSNPFSTEPSDTGQVTGLVVQLVTTVVSIILTGAFARATLDVADGGRFNFFGAFGRINMVNLVLVSLIVSLLQGLGFVVIFLVPSAGVFFLAILYVLVVSLLTVFATWAVVDGASPVAAVQRSASLVTSNFGGFLLLLLLSLGVLILGVLAICVGLLVAWPVLMLAYAYSYRRFNGQPVAV